MWLIAELALFVVIVLLYMCIIAVMYNMARTVHHKRLNIITVLHEIFSVYAVQFIYYIFCCLCSFYDPPDDQAVYMSYNLECTGLEPSIVDCDVTEVVGECFYGYLTAECKLAS